ncbi:hypothetical protein BGZ99_010367, partial [Dissophora globulifera]
MAPPLISSSSSTPVPSYIEQDSSPYPSEAILAKHELSLSTQLPPLQEESLEPFQHFPVEPTEVTIRTDVDPHLETTTTATIVHLPFQVGAQCPPPKIISWMRSQKPTRLTATPQHRPRSRPFLHRLLPFMYKRKSKKDSTSTMKKGDRAVTVFSIQVTVLGRVFVPPTPVSTPTSEQQHDDGILDLAPTKKVPAQLNRSETTSYVIHRTFEDFEQLSEMVVRLGNALHNVLHQHGHTDTRSASNIASPTSTIKGKGSLNVGGAAAVTQATYTSTITQDKPVLTALSVNHPYPGVYQTLLKQFSNVKANQRAFNASSTTHGFNEEGAFERVLELNQYLEDIWYWLLPEHSSPQLLDLLWEEVHEITQWLKPLSDSAHADGRQMRERTEPQREPFTLPQREPFTLPQYGAKSSLRNGREKRAAVGFASETMANDKVDMAVAEEPAAAKDDDKDDDKDQTEDEDDDKDQPKDKERPSSEASLPSLSSSASTAMSLGHHDYADGVEDSIHDRAVSDSPRIPSSGASSIHQSAESVKGLPQETPSEETPQVETSQLQDVPLYTTAPRGGPGSPKAKRRMSISNVLRSFTTSSG